MITSRVRRTFLAGACTVGLALGTVAAGTLTASAAPAPAGMSHEGVQAAGLTLAVEYQNCTWKVINTAAEGGLAMRRTPNGTFIVRVPNGDRVSGSDKPFSAGGLTWFDVVWVHGGTETEGYVATGYNGTSYLEVISCS